MRNEENAYQSWLWGEVLLFGLLGATLALFVTYPNLRPTFDLPQVRLVLDTTVALAAVLVAVLAGIRFSVDGRRLDLLLCAGFSLGATLFLFGDLNYVSSPLLAYRFVSTGDFLRVLAYAVLLVGVWRAIRFAEFGRAVAEERARVAREIHDGLAQYLFAVSTHATMLENGADPKTTVPQLNEAAAAAQQEARFAILALSSASGNAPFDAALRRYVDFLTADGELEVDLEIDEKVGLAPDEQIEVFRIVQEGLANARKHAGARHADVRIRLRGEERVVSIVDDGTGFDEETVASGEGLRNMKARTASIGGGFRLRSEPGRGTALEVVLRA